MKKSSFTVLLILLIGILTFISCSSDDNSNNANNASGNSNAAEPIKKAKISGLSQKGPFVEGSTATLYELNDHLEQTGRSFRDIIADNKGSFEIRNVELVSPYAMLEASGFYRNENTGEISKAPITLFAIADLREKDNVNVNILTHLEYYRVINLVENNGKSLKDAKKQAQREIFAVFGIDSDIFKDSEDMSIFGTSESDAALLAISVLLQGDLSEGEFSQRLTNFAQSLKASGGWNDEAAKKAMAKLAGGWRLENVRSNILGWGLSPTVPDFEKFVRGYWNEIFCSENNCFTDPRDGNGYKLVTKNNKTVMIDGLRYRGVDGNLGITYVFISDSCDFSPCHVSLYAWADAQNVCPAGWRLPNDSDAEFLSDCLNENLFSLDDIRGWGYWSLNGETGYYVNNSWFNNRPPEEWNEGQEKHSPVFCVKN